MKKIILVIISCLLCFGIYKTCTRDKLVKDIKYETNYNIEHKIDTYVFRDCFVWHFTHKDTLYLGYDTKKYDAMTLQNTIDKLAKEIGEDFIVKCYEDTYSIDDVKKSAKIQPHYIGEFKKGSLFFYPNPLFD